MSIHGEIAAFPLWNSGEADIIAGGRSAQEWKATGIALRPEDVKPGDLFVAAAGDDLNVVFARGAAAAMVPVGMARGCPWPVMEVRNVFASLQDLARAARFRTHATVIGVQGKESRDTVSRMMGVLGSVYEAERHVTAALAALPEGVDFAVFPTSPAVCPDIVIVSNCEAAARDIVFEPKALPGILIVNTDSPGSIEVIAMARASGVQDILTYGRAANADVRLCSVLQGDLSAMVSVDILGDKMSLNLPGQVQGDTSWLAGLLILKLSGKGMHALRNRSLKFSQAIFKVSSLVDLGRGRQTAILGNVKSTGDCGLSAAASRAVRVPSRLAHLDLVNISRTVRLVEDADDAVAGVRTSRQVEDIAPEALAPGDFIVFKEVWGSAGALFSKALRSMPANRSSEMSA